MSQDKESYRYLHKPCEKAEQRSGKRYLPNEMAKFGYKKDVPLRCKNHKEDDMKIVVGRCEIKNCWWPAKHGVDEPERCDRHC